MSLSVQTNIEAFDAHRNLVNTSNKLSESMQKLSSGYRINKAADDARLDILSLQPVSADCAK